MKYCRLVGWPDLQHYSDRAPVWIKQYAVDRSDADSDWNALTDAQRGQLASLRLLAADTMNCFPYDAEFIAEEINATGPVDLEAFGAFLDVHPSRRSCAEAEEEAWAAAGRVSPAKARASKSASKSASKAASRSASEPASKSASSRASKPASTEEEENRGRVPTKGGTTVQTCTRRGRSLQSPPAAPVPPGFSQPSPGTLEMLEDIASERGLQLPEAAAAAGVGWPIVGKPRVVSSSVTKLKTWMKQQGQEAPEKVEEYRRRADLDSRWEGLLSVIDDPAQVSREILELRKADESAAWALMNRLDRWVGLQCGRSLSDFRPIVGGHRTLLDAIEQLPEVFSDFGITSAEEGGEVAHA